MKMKGLFAFVPCIRADDTSTLLSLTLKSKLNLHSTAIENFMRGVAGRNVTEMASLMQNLAESQLFGDGVTENQLDQGDVKLDSDIAEALRTIKQLLLGDIQRALNAEHADDQKAMENLHTCWDQCKQALQDDQQQVDEVAGFMKSSKTAHEQCRKDVHAKYTEKVKKCNDLDRWIDALECPNCVKEECVVIRDPDSRKIGDMLQVHLAWATRSYGEWTQKHKACADAVKVHEETDERCDRTQGQFETDSCSYRQAVWSTCNVNKMACCERCSVDFNAEVNRVECAEKDRKIDWSATKKIECYIDVLMASPSDEELQAKCKKDGKACINQWREAKYKSCEHVCANVDFETGEYRVVNGVNTTHRGAHSHGDRCTLHLDIHFPAQPLCTDCPPPPTGPCEDPWIIEHYAEFDSKLAVSELDSENACSPDVHQRWWAYSRAECRPCPTLIGTPVRPPAIELPETNCPAPQNSKTCHFWGDPHFTHLFTTTGAAKAKGGYHGGSILEFRPTGVFDLAENDAQSFKSQVFFCPWKLNPAAPPVSVGVAMKFGDDIVHITHGEFNAGEAEYTQFFINGAKIAWDELGDSTGARARNVLGSGGLTTPYLYLQKLKMTHQLDETVQPVCAGNNADTLVELSSRVWVPQGGYVQAVTIRSNSTGRQGICSASVGSMDTAAEQEEFRTNRRHNLFTSLQMKKMCSMCGLDMNGGACGAPGLDASPELVCETAGADINAAKAACAENFADGTEWFNVCVMENCASGDGAVAIARIEEHLQEVMNHEVDS